MENLVNIIVPVYNAKHYLLDCVKSICNQSYPYIKIFLIDDGSTDKSGKICDKLAAKDSRIQVVHKENGGVMSARMAGIQLIQQEGYTTFCDSDDKMAPTACEKLLNLALTEHADVACGVLQKFFSRGIKCPVQTPNLQKAKYTFNKKEIWNKILPCYFGISDFSGYMHTKLYSNRLLKKSLRFESPVKFFQEDIAFNLQIALQAEKIAVIPDIIYYYRMGGGTSKFMPTFFDDCINLYRFKMKIIKIYNLPEQFRYTTAVELKNECYTWLEMFYFQVNGNKALVLKEIERCCKNSEVQEAVHYPKDDTSGIFKFRDLMKEGNPESLYQLLHMQCQKNKFKRKLRNILIDL